jgi:glyoxylase-like metal-dependent hydrolase (beta-lactamase superfamily II)
VTAAAGPPAATPGPVDGSGTTRARCVLAPNPGPMTLNGTNTWLIAEPGSAVAVVVDPGPDDEAHLERVRDLAAAAGQRISRILLTHGHLDHSAGAARLAGLTGAPVLAADPALRRAPGEGGGAAGSTTGDGGLGPGDVLTEAGCELRVVASPGHTRDSVCLLLPADGALLTGDTVLGRGTTVIAGDGNLADYLATLDRLRALADEQELSTLLPGHGPLLADPAGVLDFYIAHRRERLAEIRGALAAGDRTGEEIVARVYADVDRSLWPFARWSVRAQLDYLDSRGELPPGVST